MEELSLYYSLARNVAGANKTPSLGLKWALKTALA
jgi:hypothetical protein